MIHLSDVWDQKSKEEFPVECLEQIIEQEDIIENCKKYRETGNTNYKLKLYLLHTSGRNFWIDIDGDNHEDGNKNLNFEAILSQIPHVAWFLSPSAKGIKILVEVNRDVEENERAFVKRYLRESVVRDTGLIVDRVHDVAFASDQPVTFSDGIFEIPDSLEDNSNFYKNLKNYSYESDSSFPREIHWLKELLKLCPDHDDYNNWLAIVMAILKVYGEDAIEFLEAKWSSKISYHALLQCCHSYNYNIIEKIWNNRIRKNESISSMKYSRKVVTGATGAGKSAYAVNEIKQLFSEFDSVMYNYVIYVVKSVEQAIDFSKKLKNKNICYEILVGNQKYESMDVNLRNLVTEYSSNKKSVKIIQLASLKSNSYYKHIKDDNRKLCKMYIDELTLTDFVRPSILSDSLVKAYTNINTNIDLEKYYKSNFSVSDLICAKNIVSEKDNSGFISSIRACKGFCVNGLVG